MALRWELTQVKVHKAEMLAASQEKDSLGEKSELHKTNLVKGAMANWYY
ncbi:MAG: hypothetical protein MUC61_02160 [Amoebophilaceae bacterium]|nr:hypothetical protein [Amoebophilaceae bacterium]